MPDVKWYSASTSTGIAVAAGSGTTNRLMKFDASDNAADSLLSDDGTNVQLTSGQYLLSTDAGIRRDAAGSLSFSNGSTGHATGLGLGTATPKTVLSTAALTVGLQITGGADVGFVASGTNTAGFLAVDSDATANARIFEFLTSGGVGYIRRWADNFGASVDFLSVALTTDVVTLGSATVAGLTLTSGTGEISCTAGQSFNIGNAATAPASNYLVIGGVSGAGGTPTESHVTAGSGVVVYTQEAHDAQATKLVFAYNLGGSMRYITVPLDGTTTTLTHNATRP